MTDAENQTTAYEYDPLGRRTKIVWPDHVAGQNPGDAHCGFTTVTYDVAGRAILKTDQRGETITLVYDMAGRMLNRQYRTLANSPSGAIADQDSFTYDDAGRMLTAVKARYANTVTFAYTHGRKTSESLTILGQTYSVASGYDGVGRESSLTYPDGTVVTRTYTAKGQLATISRDGTVIDSRAYDNGGRLTSETLGNGLVVNRTYTADNMPASITNSAVGDYAYSWDENKNKTAETVSGAMSNFSSTMAFDNQNRLTSWNRSGGDSQSWQLSPVNDWQSVTTNGTTQTRTHGPTHEVLTVGPATIQHDSRGNITTDDANITRTYDADNKVSQATVPANSQRGITGTHTYHYDALGRRIRKTTGGTTPTDTLFVHSGQQIIADYALSASGPSTLVSRLTWGSYIDELVIQHNTNVGTGGGGNNPTDLYPHRNQQYSTTALTDQTGAVVERYAYTSYGDLTTLDPNTLAVRTTNPLTRYTYTSREHDQEINSYHFRNRDYLASLGSFNSHDSILYPDGLNTYAGWFTARSVDPLGLAEIPPVYSGDYWKLYLFFLNQKLAKDREELLRRQFMRGCVGITTIRLGHDPIALMQSKNGQPPKAPCYRTLPEAEAVQKNMKCKGKNMFGCQSSPVIFYFTYAIGSPEEDGYPNNRVPDGKPREPINWPGIGYQFDGIFDFGIRVGDDWHHGNHADPAIIDPEVLKKNGWDPNDPFNVYITPLPVRDNNGLFPGGYNNMAFCVACETENLLKVKIPPGTCPPFTPPRKQ